MASTTAAAAAASFTSASRRCRQPATPDGERGQRRDGECQRGAFPGEEPPRVVADVRPDVRDGEEVGDVAVAALQRRAIQVALEGGQAQRGGDPTREITARAGGRRTTTRARRAASPAPRPPRRRRAVRGSAASARPCPRARPRRSRPGASAASRTPRPASTTPSPGRRSSAAPSGTGRSGSTPGARRQWRPRVGTPSAPQSHRWPARPGPRARGPPETDRPRPSTGARRP